MDEIFFLQLFVTCVTTGSGWRDAKMNEDQKREVSLRLIEASNTVQWAAMVTGDMELELAAEYIMKAAIRYGAETPHE